MVNQKVLFLTLNLFSGNGGIEKVCKVVGKALSEILKEEGGRLEVLAMHDKSGDINSIYFNPSLYRSYKGEKFKFTIAGIKKGTESNIVLISHINLLIIGFAIKVLSPKTRVVLFAHGIEVWPKLPSWKRKFLNKLDHIVSVSNYTRDVLINFQKIDPAKCSVINNCLDPFLPKATSIKKDAGLMNKYNMKESDVVLLTLSRLSSRDREKGYEKVLTAMKQLLPLYPTLKYLVVGKYNEQEKIWLDGIIQQLDLQDRVTMTGYVSESDLPAYFGLSDVYVMPSTKEGFGIVFIEAMFYGKPVIAGNKDGSVDALVNGKFGLLIDPNDQQQLTTGIKRVIDKPHDFIPSQQELLKHFGFHKYKSQIKDLLDKVSLN